MSAVWGGKLDAIRQAGKCGKDLLSKILIHHEDVQEDSLHGRLLWIWQGPPARGSKGLITRRHEVLFEPSPGKFSLRPDDTTAATQPIEGDVAQGGTKRSLIEGA